MMTKTSTKEHSQSIYLLIESKLAVCGVGRSQIWAVNEYEKTERRVVLTRLRDAGLRGGHVSPRRLNWANAWSITRYGGPFLINMWGFHRLTKNEHHVVLPKLRDGRLRGVHVSPKASKLSEWILSTTKCGGGEVRMAPPSANFFLLRAFWLIFFFELVGNLLLIQGKWENYWVSPICCSYWNISPKHFFGPTATYSGLCSSDHPCMKIMFLVEILGLGVIYILIKVLGSIGHLQK